MAFLLPPTTSTHAQSPLGVDYLRPIQPKNNPQYVLYTPTNPNSGSLPSSPMFYNVHHRSVSIADPMSARSTPGIPPSHPQNLLPSSPFQAASKNVLPTYFFPNANPTNAKPRSRLSISQLQDIQAPQLDGIKTERNPYAAALLGQKSSYIRSQNDITHSIQGQGTLQYFPNDVKESNNVTGLGRSFNTLGMRKAEEHQVASRQYAHLANVLNRPYEVPQTANVKPKIRSKRPSISNFLEEPENAKEMDFPKPSTSKYLHSLKFVESKAQISDSHRYEERMPEHSRNKNMNLGENHFGFNNKDVPSMKALPIYKYENMFNVRPRKSRSIKPPKEIEILEGRISAPLNNSIEEDNPKYSIQHVGNTPKTERKYRFNVAIGEYQGFYPKEARPVITAVHKKRDRKVRKGSTNNDSDEVFELKNSNPKMKISKSQVKLPPVTPAASQKQAPKEEPERETRKSRKKEKTNTEIFENELSDVLLFGFEDSEEDFAYNPKNLPDILADLEALDTVPS